MAEHDLISKTALLRHLDMAMECKDCSRNADKELYKCVNNPTSERCTCSDIAHICNTITDFETVTDVQPVKHGKWKHVAGMNSKCSVCSHYFPVTEFDSRPFDINYCPNCGARMDLKDGDAE